MRLKTNLKLTRSLGGHVGHERVAEGPGRFGECGEAPNLEPVVVGLFPDVDVVVSVPEHPVDEPREVPGGGEDRDGAPPLWRAMRRKAAPRAVLDRWSEVAAMRRTPAMRWAPSPLRRFFRGLPPEMGVRGHRRNHETKWSSEGKAARWGPTSVRTTWAAPALIQRAHHRRRSCHGG